MGGWLEFEKGGYEERARRVRHRLERLGGGVLIQEVGQGRVWVGTSRFI